MASKSRYETITDLETQRRKLLEEKQQVIDMEHGLHEDIRKFKRSMADAERKNAETLEDKEATLNYFLETKNERIELIEAQIDSVNTALERIQSQS